MSEPGWFPDPGGEPGRLRYWNGTSWSFTTVPEADFRPPAAATPTPAPAPIPPVPAPPGRPGPNLRRAPLILIAAIVGALTLALGLLKLTEVPSPTSGPVPGASARPGTAAPTGPTAVPTNRVTADYEGCGEKSRKNGRLYWAGLNLEISSDFTVGGVAQTNGSQCMVLLLSSYDPPYDGYYLGWLRPPESVTTAEQAAVWIGEKVTDPYSTDRATVTSSRDVTVGGHQGVRVSLEVGTSGSLRQDVIVLADGGRYAFLLRPYGDWETPSPEEPVLASFRIG